MLFGAMQWLCLTKINLQLVIYQVAYAAGKNGGQTDKQKIKRLAGPALSGVKKCNEIYGRIIAKQM